MKTSLAAFALMLCGATVRAQDHAECPMAAQHAHRAQVDERHDAVSGVSHQDTVHHFLLARDGGSIHLEAAEAGQTQARDRIREHLQAVARSFAAGEFAMPMLIHDRLPPGVEVMKKRAAAIRYEYAATEKGGQVRISTSDAEALAAVHAFLRFQIGDHGTGDPTDDPTG